MNIMIFAAGKGTRLKPLTDILPKALVPVAGKPLLQHVLERVDGAGNTVCINVHHHAEQIKNWVETTRQHWQSEILISDESDSLLETGGGIKKAAPLFFRQQSGSQKPILIHNCDIISNADLDALYRMASLHSSPEAGDGYDATLLVSSRQTQRYLLFDDDMRLVGWKNIATGELKGQEGTRMYAFSGIHAISPSMISLMEQWPDKFPIMDFYLTHCGEMNIHGIVQDGLKLLDVGKLDTLENAASFLSNI